MCTYFKSHSTSLFLSSRYLSPPVVKAYSTSRKKSIRLPISYQSRSERHFYSLISFHADYSMWAKTKANNLIFNLFSTSNYLMFNWLFYFTGLKTPCLLRDSHNLFICRKIVSWSDLKVFPSTGKKKNHDIATKKYKKTQKFIWVLDWFINLHQLHYCWSFLYLIVQQRMN